MCELACVDVSIFHVNLFISMLRESQYESDYSYDIPQIL